VPRIKKVLAFVLSLVSVAGVNFIPLEMWLYRDFSSGQTMFLYLMENLMAVPLAVLFVLLFAPKNDVVKKPRTRKEIISAYLVIALTFSLGGAIFMTFFLIGILKAPLNLHLVWNAAMWIGFFLAIEFCADSLMLRPLSLWKAELFLSRRLGNVFLLFLSVFIGIFLALFVESWFVVPFVILKTLADIGEQIRTFTGYNERSDEAETAASFFSKPNVRVSR
jgi:hypothetical protein